MLAHQITLFHGTPLPDMRGFRESFLIATAAAVLGLALAAFLPAARRGGPSAMNIVAKSS